MKLFLISQDENNYYETYDAAVVCAEDEDQARLIHPCGDPNEEYKFGEYSRWCSSADKVNVKFIGDAAPGIPAGVVLASFNAG
jgi:hypothetical protein